MSIERFKDLKIENRPIEALKPFDRNARTHSKKQINQIAAWICEFGFTNPVLIDDANVIIAGHGRVAAAKVLGLDKVPTIPIGHLSEAQKRAYVIADNKLALNAGWDPEILAIEFQHLTDLTPEFDLEITGFETAEIEIPVDGTEKGYQRSGRRHSASRTYDDQSPRRSLGAGPSPAALRRRSRTGELLPTIRVRKGSAYVRRPTIQRTN